MPKLLLILLSFLYISIHIVKSDENLNDIGFTIKENDTELYDASDDYEEENIKQSFVDKLILLHREGRNISLIKNVQHINETFDRIKIVQKNLGFLFETDPIEKLKFLEFLSEIDTGLSFECTAAFSRIFNAIGKRDIWALKFFDSMGSLIPPGFVEGIRSSFGEYDECLDIVSPINSDNPSVIRGQYCLMKLILPFPSMESYREGEPIEKQSGFSENIKNQYNMKKLLSVKAMIEGLNLSNGTIYRLGICIPSVCSAHEVEYMLNKILYPITRFPLEIGPKCHTKDSPIILDNFQLVSISILSLLTVLLISSTGFEIYQKKEISEKVIQKSSKLRDLFLSFSIIRNTKLLFEKNTKFAALDTLRLLIIINVHIGHIYSQTTSTGLMSLKKIFSEVTYKVYEDNKYFFVRSPLPMDALFVLSGFLLSFTLLRRLEKTKGRFNYPDFLFQRWIRFLILIFGSIIFFYLFPLFGEGPIWDIGVQWVTPGCKRPTVLMKMFLFVSNFKPTPRNELDIAHEKCNPFTWFLSALLQFTIIAPIFIILYFKKPIIGQIAVISAIIVSLFATISPTILFGIKPYLQIWELDSIIFTIPDSFKWYHTTPNAYAISFFIGIASGFLMSKKISFTRLQENALWILSIVMIIGVYVWHNSFWRLDKSAPLWSVLLWHSFGKLFFCLGFAWIYFACCTGRGGYLNKFLSWHGFQPLARLSFGIYILHYLVIFHRMFSVKNIYVMSDKLMIEHIICDLMIDTLLAYIFYILIESPFNNIFGVLIKRKTSNNSDYLNNNNHISKL